MSIAVTPSKRPLSRLGVLMGIGVFSLLAVQVPAAAEPAASAAKVQKPGEVLTVGFDQLASFDFTAPEDPAKAAAAEAQIPARVRELDAMKVAVTGFMLP